MCCRPQALTALLLLEEGGSFVCKLFEVWTEATASLVYLLHRRFRRIAIVKPITRRVYFSPHVLRGRDGFCGIVSGKWI